MTTQNKSLQQPAYNSGSWDVPLNANFGVIDTALGSTATISSSTSTTLSSAQYQCMRLLLNGTLGADINISIPSGVSGSWVIYNATTDASAAVPCYAYITTTAGGANLIDAPRGATISIYSDGTNVYLIGNYTPAGSIIAWGGTTAPSGYVACDGTAISRSTYSALFKAIGTTWGSGNGTTTFNTPNLQGYFLRGSGTSTYDPSSPRAVGTGQADSFKSHTHTDSGHNHSYNYFNTGSIAGAGSSYTLPTSYTAASTGTGYANIQNTGGAETRPVNVAVLYCIKA